MKKVIKLLESSMLLKYKNCNEKWLVLEHEFGKDNECEVFGRMECIWVDASGIASQIENDTLTLEEIEEFIKILERSSIFKDKCILLWVELYAKEFNLYFDYMQSVEIFREACLFYLKERGK